MKYVSDCCGKGVKWLPDTRNTYTLDEGVPNVWICDKCSEPATPVEQKSGGEERG